MERIWKNSFYKGIQNDLDSSITPNESWLEAHNVLPTTNNGFLALTNLKGTASVDTLVSSFIGSSYVLGVYANKYTIDTAIDVECLTIFTAQSSGQFKIWCYDLDNNAIYELFEEDFTSEFEAGSPVIDAVVYPENGIDIVYFTDNFNEIRKLRCVIPNPYTANFLAPEQISLLRRGTMGKIALDQVTTGGSLVSGSYQFVFRFYNESKRIYTRWTIPSTPVLVSRGVTNEPSQGGYSIGTTKKIQLDVTVPTYELGNWTHFQIAVFENLQAANIVNASLQDIVGLTGGTVVGEYTIFDYDYKENSKIGIVTVEDVVVDLAALRTVKTLQIKNNMLFGGNIEYWNREYDNGAPIVTGNLTTHNTDLTDDTALSKFKGHFRDEVYRYYISYHDEFFNYSRPKRLDMSSITGNLISNKDLKFPSRKVAGYTLLTGTSVPRAVGLSVTINNHPSWARGFLVLRAKRKRRIKFQSPFIPSSLVEGTGAVGGYPTIAIEYTTGIGFSDSTNTSAQPMNPVGTILPKNYFRTVKKDIVRVDQDVTSGTEVQKGECKYSAIETLQKSNSVYFTHPPNVFGLNTYTFEVGDKYDVNDYAFLRMDYTSFRNNDAAPTETGNFLQTSVHGSFYATSIDDYYYGNSVTRADPSLPTKTGELIGYKDIDNASTGTNLLNYSVEQFENLETTGVFFNTSPTTQRTGAVALKAPRTDDALYGNSSYGGNRLTASGGGTISDGYYEINENEQSNFFAFEKAVGPYISVVPIINVVNDFGDDRYGDADDVHDIVFTGAQHIFSTTEITQIQINGQTAVSLSIFGGDCFVNLQQVKITDNHYGLVNVEKQGAGTQLSGVGLGQRWSKIFRNKYYNDGEGNIGRKYVAMPVPYQNVSQVISVMIESEVLSNIIDPYPYNEFLLANSKRVVTETDDESKLRVPFSYGYNINYSKDSDQKAFIPFKENEIITTKFKSRVVYSNQKVYQTDVQGFDVFRVLNISDLEETYGGITKLTLVADDLYAIQEAATVLLPVDAQELATTTGDLVSVRSNTVISIPRYISRLYGTQHLKSVISKDNLSIFVDNNNQAVIKLQGGAVELIQENGLVSDANQFLATDIVPNGLFGIYDNNHRQYLMVNRISPFCWLWDDRLGFWAGEFDFTTQACLYDGIFAYNKFYVLGRDIDNNLVIATMYEGDYNQLFGEIVIPSVKFVVNPETVLTQGQPEANYAKTFDNVVVYSTDKLDTMDIVSARETGTTNQQVIGINLDINRREGNYRAPILRDVDNARIRGTRAEITLYWKTDNESVVLSSVVTKYRISFRPI